MIYTPNRYRVDSSADLKAREEIARLGIWQETTKFWQAFTVPILKSVARVVVQTASKYSPPGKNKQMLGTTSIDEKYYYCRIIDLIASQKDPDVKKRPRKEDYQWIRKGYKFKILSNKYRERSQVLGYAKSMRTAKQIARIKNRGLMKYSWGTLLNNFSGRVIQESRMATQYTPQGTLGLYETELPATFRLLASKSPNIEKYRWGAITINPIDMQNLKWEMKGVNYKTDTAAFNDIATRRGVQAGIKQWNRYIRAIQNGNVNGLQRLLNFMIKKIQLKHK